MFPSDGGEDGVDEVEECSNEGEHLKQTQMHGLKPKTQLLSNLLEFVIIIIIIYFILTEV